MHDIMASAASMEFQWPRGGHMQIPTFPYLSGSYGAAGRLPTRISNGLLGHCSARRLVLMRSTLAPLDQKMKGATGS